MPRFLVEVSYLQWGKIEVEAQDEDDAFEYANDMDLDEFEETNITDFTIMDIKEIK